MNFKLTWPTIHTKHKPTRPNSKVNKLVKPTNLKLCRRHKAPRLTIRRVIRIFASDTVFVNSTNISSNIETAMLFTKHGHQSQSRRFFGGLHCSIPDPRAPPGVPLQLVYHTKPNAPDPPYHLESPGQPHSPVKVQQVTICSKGCPQI